LSETSIHIRAPLSRSEDEEVYEIEHFSINDGVFLLAYVDVNIDSSAYNPVIFHDYTLGALAIVDT